MLRNIVFAFITTVVVSVAASLRSPGPSSDVITDFYDYSSTSQEFKMNGLKVLAVTVDEVAGTIYLFGAGIGAVTPGSYIASVSIMNADVVWITPVGTGYNVGSVRVTFTKMQVLLSGTSYANPDRLILNVFDKVKGVRGTPVTYQLDCAQVVGFASTNYTDGTSIVTLNSNPAAGCLTTAIARISVAPTLALQWYTSDLPTVTLSLLSGVYVDGALIYATGTTFGAADTAVVCYQYSDGSFVWSNTFGGDGADNGLSITKLGSSLYVLSNTTSQYFSSQPTNGQTDTVLTMLTMNGTVQTSWPYGSSRDDIAFPGSFSVYSSTSLAFVTRTANAYATLQLVNPLGYVIDTLSLQTVSVLNYNVMSQSDNYIVLGGEVSNDQGSFVLKVISSKLSLPYTAPKPISDVVVVSHSWQYTLEFPAAFQCSCISYDSLSDTTYYVGLISTAASFHGQSLNGGLDVAIIATSTSSSNDVPPVVYWVKIVGTAYDESTVLCKANSLGIFIGGTTHGQFPTFSKIGDFDFFAALIKPDGTMGWLRQWSSKFQDDYEMINAVKTDSGGDLIVAGVTTLGSGGNGGFAAKLSHLDGSLLWEFSDSATSWSVYEGLDVEVATGNIYLVGTAFVQSSGVNQLLMQKLSSTGTSLWRQIYASQSNTYGSAVLYNPLASQVYVSAIVTGFQFLEYAATGSFDVSVLAVSKSTGEYLTATGAGVINAMQRDAFLTLSDDKLSFNVTGTTTKSQTSANSTNSRAFIKTFDAFTLDNVYQSTVNVTGYDVIVQTVNFQKKGLLICLAGASTIGIWNSNNLPTGPIGAPPSTNDTGILNTAVVVGSCLAAAVSLVTILVFIMLRRRNQLKKNPGMMTASQIDLIPMEPSVNAAEHRRFIFEVKANESVSQAAQT